MKVNFILPSTGESGGLKVIYRYALEFQKRGIEVRLYYPIIPYILKKSKNPVEFVYTFFRNLLSHIYHAVNKNKNPELRKILKPVLKINNFWIPDADIIIATAWPTAYDVDKLAESKGKKYYFVQGYEIWDNKELGEKSYFLPLKKIAISKWIVEQIHSQGVEEKIDIVHDGIDCESFYCNEDIEKKELKCLMLYNKLPIKGVKQGIKAFEIVKKKYHNISLTMFGLKKPKSLPENICFIENPSYEELRKLYADSDIFISPVLQEGWGLTVVEAMASRCSVVATNTGCVAELGIDGENCLMVLPNNIEELAEKIEQLIINPDLRRKIANNGFEMVQSLTWEESTKKFLEALLR